MKKLAVVMLSILLCFSTIGCEDKYEKQKKKVDAMRESYNETQAEINEIKKQIDDNQKRIDELKAKAGN